MTGIDPFSSEIIKSIASLVVKTAWEMANKPIDKSVKSVIYNASHQYFNNYKNRHGVIKALGMSAPVPLENVYINAQILDGWLPTHMDVKGSLDSSGRRKQKRLFESKEYKKRLGLEIANEHQYLMILGSPGMGKSTFLKKTGLDALKGKQGNALSQISKNLSEAVSSNAFEHVCLPVFIELKLFKSEDREIENLISEEFKICGFPDYQQVTEKHLEKGKLLILLDGLDEVPSELMNHVISKIQDFVDRYPKNRFIVSCRRAAYHFNFRRFVDVAIADFEDRQIQSFIMNWFHRNPQMGKECWQKLNSEDYQPAKELTHTPLLLTLVCLLYERAGQFPTNRSTLYNRALRVLLEEWAAEKLLPQENVYRGLDTRRKELMLSKIAYDAFQKDLLFLNKRDLSMQIEQLLGELLPDEKVVDGDKVLKSIELQHGVLVERVMDVYSFSHLTLQEFLTAQYIADDHKKIESAITNYLISDRWYEIFLLIAGLKQQTDEFLLKIEQRAQIYSTNAPKLQALIRWSKEVTSGSSDGETSITKKALAIALALDCTRALRFISIIAKARKNIRQLLIAISFKNPNLQKYLNQFNQELRQAHEFSQSLKLACDQAHLLSQEHGYRSKLILKIELSDEVVFEQLQKLAYTLDYNQLEELSKKLDQIRISVFNDVLRSVVTDNFAGLQIFQKTSLNDLSKKLLMLRNHIPKSDQPWEIQKGFVQQIHKVWFDALKLTPELVNLSISDLETLEAYLKANKLLTACYSSAVWVKPKTWQGIHERMLEL